MDNQFHEYNEQEFNSLPWANDFMNADPSSNEFSNAMAEADKYYGPEWTDKQLESWGIQFEKEAEAGNINPEQLPDNSPIQKEVEQLTDNNPNNNEIRNDVVEDFIKQQEELNPPKTQEALNKERFEQDMYKDMLNQERADEVDADALNGYGEISVYPEEDKPSMYRFKKGSHNSKKYKELIGEFNNYPTSQRNAALDILGNLNGQIDVDTLRNANPWMDEGLAMVITQLSEDNPVERYHNSNKATLKDEKKPGSSFTSGINWDKVKVYQPGEEPSPFGVKVDYDPEVEKMNNSFAEDLENKIENQPNEIIEDPSMPSDAKEEAVQVLDGDKRTNEANNDKVETAVEKLSEDFDTVDDLAAYLDENQFFPEDKENPDAPWNRYESPAEAYRNYVDPEDTEKWKSYLKDKEAQPEAEADAELAEAQIDPVAAANKALATPALNETLESTAAHGASYGNGSESLSVDRMKSIGSSFSHALANLGTGSGQSSAPSVGNATSTNNKVESVTSHAGGGEIPNELPNASISNRNASSNGYVTSNGGSYNSGGIKHTGNSLKAQKVVLPSGDSKDQPDSADIDLKSAHIENLEQRIRSIPQGLAEQLGFNTKYKHITYKGLNISECGPKELEEIESILSILGV